MDSSKAATRCSIPSINEAENFEERNFKCANAETSELKNLDQNVLEDAVVLASASLNFQYCQRVEISLASA
jgi:hypothetical protein